MSLIVVTEGPSDVAALRPLLDRALRGDEYRILSAGGRSPAVSLARSFLATSSDSVALVVDADTFSGEEIERRRRYLRDALSDVADPSRFLLLLAVPDLPAALSGGDGGDVAELIRFAQETRHVGA